MVISSDSGQKPRVAHYNHCLIPPPNPKELVWAQFGVD
jgi:hypothetical protein